MDWRKSSYSDSNGGDCVEVASGDWRKPSYSNSNGGSCVEVASDVNWRKPSYSESNGGSCVETASGSGVILVRDTTNRDGGTLAFSAGAWVAFTARLQ
jgi:hypothetical protein